MAGRRRNPTFIVNPHEILSIPVIEAEIWTTLTLPPVIHNPELSRKWLAARHLLHNTCTCSQCGNLCTLNNNANSIDGVRWRCFPCQFTQSIRVDSFFIRSHLSLPQLIMLIFQWSKEAGVTESAGDIGVNCKTVTDWFNFCRDICATWMEKYPPLLGGFNNNLDPIVVEIDESCFFKRKFHRGAFHMNQWLFGGIQRGSRKCFVVPVKNRKANTLLPLIEKYILPGSHIMSDEWQAYNGIRAIGGGIYSHSTINHSTHFVHPDDNEVHTQSVESA